MSQKWFKMVVLSLSLLLVSLPVWAGMEDIIKKQKKLEQEENKMEIKAKAIGLRMLEIFNIIASVVEELDSKGIKFEKIATLHNDDKEFYIFGRDLYLRVLTQRLSYKIIAIDGVLSTLMPQVYIIFKPKVGNTCRIEITWRGEAGLELEMGTHMIIPIYDNIEEKKADLRNNAMNLIESCMK